MKCPLRTTTTHYPDEQVGIDTWACIKEECAWWEKGTERCAILELNEMLAGIVGVLAEIRNIFPRGG
ncbi:hypothetical protein ES703_09065 [subsurface metagenome]